MCGVFGIRSRERDVARVTYFGLFALQHRGQEAAGTCVVRAYRCRYDYGDDVERVRCTAPGRLIAFRSVA